MVVKIGKLWVEKIEPKTFVFATLLQAIRSDIESTYPDPAISIRFLLEPLLSSRCNSSNRTSP